MSSATGSNGRMAQLGLGHRISSQNCYSGKHQDGDVEKNLHQSCSLAPSQPVDLNPLPALHWIGICYTRISNAATGAPLAALIAAAYIPACRR